MTENDKESSKIVKWVSLVNNDRKSKKWDPLLKMTENDQKRVPLLKMAENLKMISTFKKSKKHKIELHS